MKKFWKVRSLSNVLVSLELIYRVGQLLKACPAGISVQMILNFRSEF